MVIIGKKGLDQLSLREVARRLDVSHGAPYRHYPTRDHLLAEVIRRCYGKFAKQLDAHLKGHNPDEDLEALGVAYLNYALHHPLEYHLMFATRLPDPASHPEMMASADHAFGLLRQALRRRLPDLATDAIDAHALFIWSSLHGLATALRSDVLTCLALPPQVIRNAVGFALARIGQTIEAQPVIDGTRNSERLI